jgi:hypothetical protein
MIPQELGTKVRKIVTTSDRSLINNVYVSPLFVDDLMNSVEELEQIGITSTKTETESSDGTVVSADLQSKTGVSLPLGSVLLDGRDVIIQSSLVTIDELVNYIENQAPEVF